MGKGAILIGIALIIFGVWFFYTTLNSDSLIFVLIYPIISIAIGIALIIFYREEDKIEQRKDLKNSKTR